MAAFLSGGRAWSAAPSLTFYVPFPEADALTALTAVESGGTGDAPVNPMITYISVAAVADGTIIYYDQWEDGYEHDHDYEYPLQSTTQIWGDGNPANGAPPNVPSDRINAGTVILLYNSVPTSNPLLVDFDARDKIVATRTISVTRTYWATTTSTLFAGCVETFDTSKWGIEYRSPIGQNIPDSADAQMFEYTALSVLARDDGTTLLVDADNNGAFEATNTLNEGQTAFVSGVNVGGRVVADKPIQTVLFSGDVGSNYESRDSSLLPTSLWSSNYYTPVSTPDGDATRVWLYNPSASAISITFVQRVGAAAATTGTVSVTAGSYNVVELTNGAAARFYTTGATPPVFYAYSTTDSDSATTSDNQAWDWSFTLIPERLLSPQILVGLGIGRDPLSATNPSENGNPIWVTPVGNGNTPITVYIDYDGDNAGAYTDANGNRYDASTNLIELQQAKLFDPDGDQTAMLVYVLSTNVTLAAAWGQDTLTATAGAPGLDVGTSIPPVDVIDVNKDLSVASDVLGDGVLGPGDRAEYFIRLGNTSRAPIPADVIIQDALSEGVSYVTGSTSYRTATNASWVSVSDDASGTLFPLDGAGLRIQASVPVKGEFAVRFLVDVNTFSTLEGLVSIINTGVVRAVVFNREVTFRNETELHGSLGDRVWYDADGDGVQDPSEPGLDGVTVFLDVNNNGMHEAGEPYDVTEDDGHYLLTGTFVEAGPHTVRVDTSTVPAGYVATADLDGLGTPHAASLTLMGGEDRLDVDFGYRAVAQLSGTVFVDVNGNGVAETEDTNRLAGVTILLLDAVSNTVASTQTSAFGYYEFVNVSTGAYTVVQVPPAGYVNTLDVAGPNDLRIPLTLAITQNATGNDFYDTRSGSVSPQNKVLYLSDPGASLDRVDPVVTGDSTTATSAVLIAGESGPASITVVGAAASSSSAQTATTHAFTYNSGSTGTNRILMVGISYRNNDSETVSSVTYGGQTLTSVGTAQIASGTPDGRIYIYRLVNPPGGNNTLQVTWSSALNQGAVVGAVTYSGVNPSTPTGTFASSTGTSATPAVTVASESGQLVFGVVSGRSTSAYTVTGGGTSLWSAMPYSGQTAGSGQSKAGSASSVNLSWGGSSAEWVAGGVSLVPASNPGNPTISFTQAPAFALPFNLAANATISITNYVNVTSGSMPANPAVTARLSANGTTFLTLSNPTYNSGSGTLVWTGALPGAVAVAAGQAISLSVSNAQSGVEFQLRYDSASYPSKIILPTASLIEVPSLSIYDAPYAGGQPVSSSPVGAVRYVRVTATDPFGVADITGVGLAIDGPGVAGDVSVSLGDASVVASNGWSKTYEYPWTLSQQPGDYSITATAHEGFEGITATSTATQKVYSAAVFGYVFNDKNEDLLRDSDDTSATNALVTLYVNGLYFGARPTDALGFYRFDDIPVGTVSILVSRASSTLIGVPAEFPAATDERRNRALPAEQETAYIVYEVYAGYGVLPETPGETLNFGFTVAPLSSEISLKTYATANGGALIDLRTVDESGRADIVLYARIQGKWVEVGRVPADQVAGEGSNRYLIHAPALEPGAKYWFMIVDEAGNVFYLRDEVEVEVLRIHDVAADREALHLSFASKKGCKYRVLSSDRLDAPPDEWKPQKLRYPKANGSWSEKTDKPFTAAPEAATKVRIDKESDVRRFFKVELID